MKDKRYEKSCQALRSAYEALIAEKDPASLTIRELCETAGLNRATFYNHYGYLENFEYELITEQVRAICHGHQLEGLANPISPDQLKKAVIAYIAGFISNDIIMQLIRSRRSDHYCSIMIEVQVNITLNHHPSIASVPANTPEYESLFLEAYFQNSAVYSTIIRWILGGMKLSPEQLSDIIWDHCALMNERIARLQNKP